MIPRRALERLCKSDEITQTQSETVYALLKAVAGHLFSNLSTSIFQHADQLGRDAILRALSHSAAHLELNKVFCSLDDENVTDIFDTLAVIKFQRQKENADGDVRRAQEALFSPRSTPITYGEDYSPTPDPAEMRIAKWISDQNTLLSEHDKSSEHVNNRKRHHSEIASDGHDSSHVDDALPEIEPQERVGVRRQPNRSCKSKGATQSAMPDGKRDLRTRKVAPPESNKRSTRGIFKPTTRSGNIRLRRIRSNKEPTTLHNEM
ncbi:MAG: hypothetical protein LQ341_002190 [Variospora aurantia]|nr:MAG: hypothetical protein LQ341_002190 [Variospora aurantia]